MDWKTLLADKSKFGDDVQVTISGESVSLGDLRRHNEQTHGATETALQTREAAIAERETKYSTATGKLADIMEAVAKASGLSFDQIIAGDTAAAAAAGVEIRKRASEAGVGVTDGKIDWKSDPIYAPIDERLRPMESGVATLSNAVRASIQTYQNDRPRIAYIERRLSDGEATKNIKYTDAVKLAVDKGYKDDVGFPDVGRAMDDLIAPLTQKSREEQIRAEARAEGEAEARRTMMAGAGMPTGTGAAGVEFQATPDPGKRPPTFAEQLSKAMTDPTMLTSSVQ